MKVKEQSSGKWRVVSWSLHRTLIISSHIMHGSIDECPVVYNNGSWKPPNQKPGTNDGTQAAINRERWQREPRNDGGL